MSTDSRGAPQLHVEAAHGRSLLDPSREVTAEERAAMADEPAPGIWVQEVFVEADAPSSYRWVYEVDRASVEGKGRALTQDETDILIRSELYFMLPLGTTKEVVAEMVAIVGEPGAVSIWPGKLVATMQRGGIDSDPLVRLLAYRAWGDRDQRWFAERGVRQGELVALSHGTVVLASAYETSAHRVVGRARHDARPGELVEVEEVDPVTLAARPQTRPHYARYRVGEWRRVTPGR